jgi:seryl-tRNA synthetase
MISLFDEIDKRLEDARKLVLELEDLKKEVNLISKQIELMKIRTPQNDKELKERLDNVSSKVDESKEKRRLLENLFQNILKKK